jgi:hypothetical protein
MAKLATMRDIIGTEQDADIAVKFGLLTFACTPRCPVLSVQGQVPSKLIAYAFFGVNEAIDCLLANPLFSTLKDHSVADLLGRPAVLQTGHNVLTELWISEQLALRGPSSLRALVCGHPEVSRILLGERIIGPEITFDLSKDRGLVTPQHARHLGDWDFRVPPVFNSPTFLHA